jgi:hypothetical protein
MERFRQEMANTQRRANALQHATLMAVQRAEEARLLNPLLHLG